MNPHVSARTAAASPTTAPPTGTGRDGSRPVASYRTDLVTTLLGVWFTVGLFLDAWAHNNVPELETFFTPWHAAFYSGFVATAGWVVWTCRRALLGGRLDLHAIPMGYGATLIALVAFAISAVGDLTWHTVLGIEQSIDILFSPTHLGLVTAMLVILTTPLRSAWRNGALPADPGLRRLLAAIVSASSATTLVLLFLQYANALTFDADSIVFGLSDAAEAFTARLVSSVAVTNLVVLVPLLATARRWRLPLGTATVLYLAVAGLSGAVTGFANLSTIVGFLVAGLGVDLLLWWLRPTPERVGHYRAFGALAPIITWGLYIAIAFVTAGATIVLPEDGHADILIELTTGVPAVQALLGLLAAILLAPRLPSADRLLA